MKSENQIIIRCKQPIKMEKPFQSLLTFPYIAGEKKYSSDRFVVIFSVFILSMHSKVIIIVIEFTFLGINIFWALLRAHFNPRLMAWAKTSLSWAQNIFMPVNINSVVLLYQHNHFFRGPNNNLVFTLLFADTCEVLEKVLESDSEEDASDSDSVFHASETSGSSDDDNDNDDDDDHSYNDDEKGETEVDDNNVSVLISP